MMPIHRCVASSARRLLVALSLLAATASVHARHEPAVSIVSKGGSNYVIYRAANAPSSVVEAAQELQSYVARSTGVTVSVSVGGKSPPRRFISLGDNSLLRSARLPPVDRPEGFRVAIRNGNVFIYGIDTLPGERLGEGGTSAGTLNGVYTVLERFLGVRWLVPGPYGDDVPPSAAFTIPAIDIVEFPGFANRRIPYIQNEHPEVARWSRRQRLGYSVELNHAHNWDIITPAEFETHPSWFASAGGRRTPPTGWYKLETTNAELVGAFANRAALHFRRSPNTFSFSMSPSDGGGWSDSVESRSLYDIDKHGHLSVTPLVLKFYDDVARILRSEYPDKLVCGYIYADYLFPPSSGIPPLEPNVCLVLAPSIDYGYQLFRAGTRQDSEALIATWSHAAPNVAYYDLPVTLLQTYAAPTPPVPEILRFVYRNAHKAGMKGIYIYGVGSWGYGAATNYLEAKLAWDPDAEPEEIARDFYLRAYGDVAGPVMQELYGVVEAQLRAFYIGHPDASFRLTSDMLKDVYAPQYQMLEALYLKALSATVDPGHRHRIEMFGETLEVLRWNLRKQAMIPDVPSKLSLTDSEIRRVLATARDDLALDPAMADAVLASIGR